MGFSFSKSRRSEESRPHPEPPSSSPVPSLSLPPPPPQPPSRTYVSPALPPPSRPSATSSPPPPPSRPYVPPTPPPPQHSPPPTQPPSYPYASSGPYSTSPSPAAYSPYSQRPYYAPYAPQPSPSPYSYQTPYGYQPQTPHYSHFVGYYDNRWCPPAAAAAAGPSAAAPPPYVEHKTAKKVKNDVNVHKDTIKFSLDEQNPDSHLVSFTFDALVDGSITVLYFAKEGPNCTFSPTYTEIYTPQRIPFQKGLGQKFHQPSGSGIDLGFFDTDELSKPSQNEEVFPLVIYAETSRPSLMDAQPDQQVSRMSSHAQITEAVIVKGSEGNLEVKVIKQILWVEGVRYELREIYGISSSNADQQEFEDNDPGKECVICMTEPKDTAVLPCRHMCLCGECAKELRLRSDKCPICRQPIQELLEIKVNNATPSSS